MNKNFEGLTHEFLKSVLHYNPDTGDFTWLVALARKIKIGQIAGSEDKLGYRTIFIRTKRYKAHRLAFFYMTGNVPDKEIDHINCIPSDNRWENIRLATRSQNIMNTRQRKNTKTGIRGVYMYKKTGIFAQVEKEGDLNKKKFDSIQDAEHWVRGQRKIMHGEFYRD